MAAAALLRRTVRKENTFLLPYLTTWGALCAFPSLAFVLLCLPPFADLADRVNAEIAGTRFEILAGIAGVLPGLLWDEIDERIEADRELPFRLPAAVLRAGMIAVLLVLILLPYGFLFNRQDAPQTQPSRTTEVPAANP